MKHLFWFILIIASILFTLFLFEISYRIFPQSFKGGIDYQDVYQSDTIRLGGLLKPSIDTLVINRQGANVKWITNKYGFRNNTPFNLPKSKGTYRIISIGDSFTSGYRVDQNESFSFLLQELLNKDAPLNNYEVWIVNIEDPATGLSFLQKFGSKLDADFILWGITLGNDITQSYLKTFEWGKYNANDSLVENGNYKVDSIQEIMHKRLPTNACSYTFNIKNYLEKFISLKLISSIIPKAYSGESIFASNGKTNPVLFDLSNGLGLYLVDQPSSVSKAYTYFLNNLTLIKKWCDKNGTLVHFVLFPQRFQVQPVDWDKTIKHYDLKQEAFDLSIPNNIIMSYCINKDINVFDLTPSLKNYFLETKMSIYLPLGDMHWNEHGHKIVSEKIFNNVFLPH